MEEKGGMSRVEAYVRSRVENDPLDEANDLILDGFKIRVLSPEDAAFLQSLPELHTLSMNQCSLTSVENLPPLPRLKNLELQDNKLKGRETLARIVAACPNLEAILLANNRFADLADFEPLKNLKDVTEIDVESCPITAARADADRARKWLFKICPEARIVNGCDVYGNEVEEASDEESADEKEEADGDSFVVQSNNDDELRRKQARLRSEGREKGRDGGTDEDEENNSEGDSESHQEVLKKFFNSKYTSDDEKEDDNFDPDEISDQGEGESDFELSEEEDSDPAADDKEDVRAEIESENEKEKEKEGEGKGGRKGEKKDRQEKRPLEDRSEQSRSARDTGREEPPLKHGAVAVEDSARKKARIQQ